LSTYTPFPTRNTTATHPNDSASVSFKRALTHLCNVTPGQFRNFRSHFIEADFSCWPKADELAQQARLPSLLEKLALIHRANAGAAAKPSQSRGGESEYACKT
jgi:hypothetical protein